MNKKYTRLLRVSYLISMTLFLSGALLAQSHNSSEDCFYSKSTILKLEQEEQRRQAQSANNTTQNPLAAFSDTGEGQSCGHDPMHRAYMQSSPDYRKRVQQMEEQLHAAIQAQERGLRPKSDDILTVPMVFHIIHKPGEAIGQGLNITDAQIEQGMLWMNEAFRNTGPYADDALGAKDPNNPERNKLKSVDTQIEFALAKQDVFGAPTTGILRYANEDFIRILFTKNDFQMKQWVAEQNGNRFPTENYANVYLLEDICQEDGTDCGSIAGYAFLANANGQFYDGVVAETFRFGDTPANTSVMVHEFGHYLNLRHTFWNGCPAYDPDCGTGADGCTNDDCFSNGDYVCDTPPDNSTSGVSCGNTANSCGSDTNSGFSTDQNDMIENYMDYGFYDCYNTFTSGQKNRMRVALEEFRPGLFNSVALQPVSDREVEITNLLSPSDLVSCVRVVSPVIEVRNGGVDNITRLSIQAEIEGIISITEWTGNLEFGEVAAISLNSVELSSTGNYSLNVLITKVNDIFGDSYEENNSLSYDFDYQAPLRFIGACEEFIAIGEIPVGVDQPTDRKVTIDVVEVSGCESNGDYALRVNSWDENLRTNLTGEIALPSYDLNIYQSPILVFERSYRQSYSTSNTALRVLASTDCGITFEEVYYKAGPELATRSGFETGMAWTPTECNEWKKDTIDLSPFRGENAVTLIFEVSAANIEDASSFQWGNNLYLDNICVRESDAVASCTLIIDSVAISNPTTCGSSDGTILISANVNEGLEYSIDGTTWQASNLFEGLVTGTYSPQVRDAEILACKARSAVAQLAESLPPLVDNVIVNEPSDCSEANGIIEIIAFGDSNSGAIEYSIDGINWQSTSVFTGLVVGTYIPTVRYTNAPACQTGVSRTLEAPNGPEIAEIQLTNPATCKGVVGELVIVVFEIAGINYEYSIDGGETWQSSNVFTNLQAGEYTPQVRNAESPACVGNVESISLVGEADGNITGKIRTSSDSICIGSFTRLLIGAANGSAPYEVIYTDGTEEYTTVVTFGEATVVVRPAVTTTYSLVRVTDITGCSTAVSGSTEVVVEDCGNGLIDGGTVIMAHSSVGDFYPNPSNATVSLDYTASHTEQLIVQVFDITGKQHLTKTTILEEGYNRLSIDLSSLPNGTYVVKLRTANQQFVRKVIRD